jgi:hypothetical protein
MFSEGKFDDDLKSMIESDSDDVIKNLIELSKSISSNVVVDALKKLLFVGKKTKNCAIKIEKVVALVGLRKQERSSLVRMHLPFNRTITLALF